MKAAIFSFRFGEHFYQSENTFIYDLFVQSIAAILGFAVALLIFRKSITHENNKKREFETNLLTYYAHLLNGVVTFFEKQISFIDDYISRQKENLYEGAILKRSTSNDFKRLTNIDHNGVFETFVKNFPSPQKIETYQKNNANLDFLEGVWDEIERLYDGHTEEIVSITNQIKGIIDFDIPDTMGLEIEEIRQKDPNNYYSNRFHDFLDQQLMALYELLQNGASLGDLNEQFLEPLILTLQEEFSSKSTAIKLMAFARKARILLGDIKSKNEHIIGQFSLIRNSVQGSLLHLKTVSKDLRPLVSSIVLPQQ